MTQSLLLVGVFVVLLACLPMAIDQLKKRYGLRQLGPDQASRVVSVLAVGPQQKVLTVEVGPPDAKVWLVLGVTAQSVSHLHTLTPSSTGVAKATEMAAVQAASTDVNAP